MTQPLFSPLWYKVADLRPRLQAHASILRHRYRGRRWYVLEDRTHQRTYRFPETVYDLLARMDGKTTVQQVWEAAIEDLGEEAPTQDELVQLLCRLEEAGALAYDVAPEAGRPHFTAETGATRRRRGASRLLFVRLPLLDPDALLERCAPFVKACFSRTALLIWAVAACAAAGLGAIHWTDLTTGFLERVRPGGNLILLWMTFLLTKALHELGHAFAVKANGGEVHEMGVSFLFFSPVPYVNASGASAFPSKRHRMLVGAAGMMVEIFLASMALFLWLSVEPGLFRSFLHDLLVVTGLSTLLFNANPLLRLDGYYILCDWLEIPNLRARSAEELRHLAEKRLFGLRDSVGPAATRTEAVLFTLYGISSTVYRLVLLGALCLWLGSKSLVLGLLLGAGCAAEQVILPLFRAARHLVTSPRLQAVRPRAIAALLTVAFLLLALTCVVPFPLRTLAEGVVRAPEDGIVRTGADLFVERALRAPGTLVRRADPLFAGTDPLLATRVKVLEAELEELHGRRDEALHKDIVEAQMLRAEIARRSETLAQEKALLEQLTVLSPTSGVFLVPQVDDLPGRFMKKGSTLGYVIPPGSVAVRVVVPQEDIDAVRHRTGAIAVRFPQVPIEVRQISMVRAVPAASDTLPSPALGTLGGGQVPVRLGDGHGVTAAENVFHLEIELPWASDSVPVGGRAWVRMHHGYEPLIMRWSRGVRRLLLRRLGV